MNTANKLLINKIKLGFLLLPAGLIFLPANFFDKGKSVCLSKFILNKECWGCGITRAIQHAIHFEFKTAYEFNKLVIVVLPLVIFVYIQELIKSYKSLNNL